MENIQKTGKKLYPPFIWILLHFCTAASALSFLIISIRITGVEIIEKFFQISFRYYPALLLILPGILIIFFTGWAIYGITKIRKNSPFILSHAAKIFSITALIFIIIIAHQFPKNI